jgi:DNA uptake protein ComE-like DNA-binding protein
MARFIRSVITLTALVLIASTAPVGAQAGKRTNVLDANTATEAQIAALPHMNAARAKALVAARPFLTAQALDAFAAAQGLTPDQRKELYGKLFVQINLNTATREEILLVPGAGNRMVREFAEYRPWKSILHFRKEIGKYVDAAELARLEEYVFVPLNLNTATDEEMMTIPGVGSRMVREFKEYRPWKTAEQFRKEIGKYVDQKEVARLERYVIFQ